MMTRSLYHEMGFSKSTKNILNNSEHGMRPRFTSLAWQAGYSRSRRLPEIRGSQSRRLRYANISSTYPSSLRLLCHMLNATLSICYKLILIGRAVKAYLEDAPTDEIPLAESES